MIDTDIDMIYNIHSCNSYTESIRFYYIYPIKCYV